ncbi:hypothetical protein L3X38_003640 [Prunus dulcis]|uniref:Uncharacterized protein n=1 Tax=Prunus dulcis TaxID=3755 RepID=A0AAD5F2C8_PRUDU|nr:hypothetical protein L3X38_003640 [Prunus dulcis]
MRNRKLPFEVSNWRPEAAIRGLKLAAGSCHSRSQTDILLHLWMLWSGVGSLVVLIELLMQQRGLVPEQWRNVAGQIGHHRL